jgi:tetratricopeptide (TPR) repeat protein
LNGPFPAYRGTESYVFVCYAHKDSDHVYSDLAQLADNGVNLWYDEGIPAGASWRAEIAAAIKDATRFLFFISEASLNSTHCLREVDYALSHDIEIVPVYLDDSSLPGELELALNRVQALFRATDATYMPHLLGALQQHTPLNSRLPVRAKRRFRRWLPVLLLGFSLPVLFLWRQREITRSAEPVNAGTVAAPNSFDLYLEGLELFERWDKDDNLDKAIGLFGEAAVLDPSFALAYARGADALLIRYALTRDESWLKEAARSADEAVRLNDGLAPVQVALGRIHAARGNIDIASAALEKALSIDANDAAAHQAMAVVQERQGRMQDAEASFLKAVTLNPSSPAILDSYANFLYRQSRFSDAIHQWQAVIRIAPDHFAALVNLGSALSETGKFPLAITMFERAIEIRPTYMAFSNLGTAYSRAERYPDAVDAYRRALEIDDTDWLAWGNLAYVYSWVDGMEAQAVETFDRAIALAETTRERSPRDAFVHSDLALYYAKTGRAELALQRLAAAITLSPDSGEIQAAAAEAYELVGRRDEAIELALRSLEFGYTKQHFQRNPEMSDLLSDPRMQISDQ